MRSLAAVAKRPMLLRVLLGPIQLSQRLRGRAKRKTEIPPPQTHQETFALHFASSNQEHMREQLAQADPAGLIPEP